MKVLSVAKLERILKEYSKIREKLLISNSEQRDHHS